MTLLGLLTGMVQAYIFFILAAVYIAAATQVRKPEPKPEPNPLKSQPEQQRKGYSMDSMTIIAVASIVTAGLTIAIGVIGPSLGEGRAVATALTSLAQQPDASATITRTLFVGLAMIESTAIYCFVVSMILLFANPFWNQRHRPGCREVAMLIDWFTVAAQVVNFLILVWLLKRFLYRPILDAIDAREKRIAAELADADAKKAEARKERDEFQHKNEAFEQQRAALLSQATEEAKAERQRLLDEARQAADALSAKRMQTLSNDTHNLNQAIRRRTQQEVFAIARKALTRSRHGEPGRTHG